MTRAYRGPVFGGGPDTTEGLRSRVARGRPNWWVILAVSLGLMALLVATAGSTPPAPHTDRRARPRRPARHSGVGSAGRARPCRRRTTTIRPRRPTTTHHAAARPRLRPTSASSLAHDRTSGTVGAPPSTAAPSVTTTTVAPATTTTTTTDPSACGAGRPHADPGLPQSPAPDVEQVRVHRDGRHGDLGGLVREHVPHHGGQLPERGAERRAGPLPWRRRCPTPAGVAWPP